MRKNSLEKLHHGLGFIIYSRTQIKKTTFSPLSSSMPARTTTAGPKRDVVGSGHGDSLAKAECGHGCNHGMDWR
jgi:hypothetical protein